MSRPENPLTQFRSYAYHHILIACDSSSTAEALAFSSEIDINSEFVKNSRKPQEVEIPPNSTTTNRQLGQYVVLINGMVDAEFMITNAEWDSMVIPKTNNQMHMTSQALDGKLRVIEPRGARFFNILIQAANDLHTDPTGIVFLLKTVFVGHGYNGDSNLAYSQPITNIKPLLFYMWNISAAFDQQGGIYEIEFLGLSDGVAKVPQLAAGDGNLTVNLCNKVPSVKNALEQLAANLNERYELYFEEQNEKMKESIINSVTIPKDIRTRDKFFRKVQYSILLDKNYGGDDANKYLISTSRQAQSSGGTVADPILSFGENPSIESAIKHIMESCPQVGEDAKEKTNGGDKQDRYIFKVKSTIDSTSEIINVVYHVSKQKVPTTKTIGLIERVLGAKSEEELIAKLRESEYDVIEFDYIYTGKNVDIKAFDIKMEMGMSFFMTMSTTDNLLPLSEQVVQSTSAGKDAPTADSFRYLTPLFPQKTMRKTSARGTSNPTAHANFQSLLSKHAATETFDVNLTIVGNPLLLSDTTQLPSEVIKGENLASRVTISGTTNNNSMLKYWSYTPGLVKINIKMPTNKSDEDYSESFWYRGFYAIMSVKNVFDRGEFTQDISLMSIPRETLYDDKENTEERAKQRELEESCTREQESTEQKNQRIEKEIKAKEEAEKSEKKKQEELKKLKAQEKLDQQSVQTGDAESCKKPSSVAKLQAAYKKCITAGNKG